MALQWTRGRLHHLALFCRCLRRPRHRREQQCQFSRSASCHRRHRCHRHQGKKQALLFTAAKTPSPRSTATATPLSDRDAIVFQIAQALEPLGVPLRAPGACLNNMQWIARSGSKFDILRPYKFCVAMENSEDDHCVVGRRATSESQRWLVSDVFRLFLPKSFLRAQRVMRSYFDA